MISLDSVMSQTLVYRLWMAPFAEKKIAPLKAFGNLKAARRVLDVGCGPGTNFRHFSGSQYLGIDVNEKYIESARRRYGNHFVAADAAEFLGGASEQFDLILVNSFLHHLDTPTTRRILANLGRLLAEDGHVHVLELILPQSPSLARFMARCDRGKFPREKDEWTQIFQDAFELEVLKQFGLGVLGLRLWDMIYFKGRIRKPSR
jgi:SAM-dependent methyltransferase